MKHRIVLPVLSCFVLLLAASCVKERIRNYYPVKHKRFRLDVPAHFSYPDVRETMNPLTEEGVALGRKLFYDKRLSGNNLISCGSCHQQDKGFGDGVVLSNIGVSGARLHRHAPALINVAWMNNGFFWDGGATNLESQAFGPLAAHDEMYQNLYELIDELKAVPEYITLFREAFGDDIDERYVVKALGQFQRTFISAGSRYDDYVQGKPAGVLSEAEKQGLQLVTEKCMGCHSGVLFTDNVYHNNGLDSTFSSDLEGIYLGRYRVTYNPMDLGSFKTPTLRNIMLTAPYMHDGRFNSIQEVLDHYDKGVKAGTATDHLVMKKKGGQPGIPMTTEEKNKIIAFLKTLTDDSFIHNPKLAEP